MKVEEETKLKIMQKIKEMSQQKFTTSQQINIKINDHHSCASHNKQQKHYSSVHCYFYYLILSSASCLLLLLSINYRRKTSNQANLDSRYNCHHENSSLVDVHVLMKESVKIMITHCITT